MPGDRSVNVAERPVEPAAAPRGGRVARQHAASMKALRARRPGELEADGGPGGAGAEGRPGRRDDGAGR